MLFGSVALAAGSCCSTVFFFKRNVLHRHPASNVCDILLKRFSCAFILRNVCVMSCISEFRPCDYCEIGKLPYRPCTLPCSAHVQYVNICKSIALVLCEISVIASFGIVSVEMM